MRRLTFIVLILAAIYAGYWFIGAGAMEKSAADQFNDLEKSGWQVDYTDLSTAGFPSRFDTTVNDLTLTTPDGATQWSLAFIQALTLAYKPNEIILAFPPNQVVTVDRQPISVTSDSLRASLKVAPNPALSLGALTAEVGPLTATTGGARLLSLTSGLAALRAAEGDHTYDAYLDMDGFALPDQVKRMLDPSTALPQTFGQITIDAILTLDADIDRHSAKSQPQIDTVDLRGMTITWGDLQLRSDGSVTIDSDGYPTGDITLSAQNWRKMLPLAVNAGVLTTGAARTIENVAGLLSGGSQTLDIPFRFANQQMMLGPIPIGKAPRLR
jgi:hypothetical protein